jgi:D-threo-aldose 1-dehydrogenase
MNKIGFGCSKLTSNLTHRQALKNLEVAYDNGVTHFDVARLYGYGLAENILGKFAAGKRRDITITTKAGILPKGTMLQNLLLQNMLRHSFQMVKTMVPKKDIAQMGAMQTMSRGFNIKDIRASLETSLKELKTDYIDYLMLHEADINEANNETLIGYLEEQKTLGNIKEYGIASYSNKIEAEFDLLKKNYTVLQTDNSFPQPVPAYILNAAQIKERFYFSPFVNLKKIEALLKSDPVFTRKISELMNFDVLKRPIDLLLIHQKAGIKSGTFLFASANNKNIAETITRWNYIKTLTERSEGFLAARKLIAEKFTTN